MNQTRRQRRAAEAFRNRQQDRRAAGSAPASGSARPWLVIGVAALVVAGAAIAAVLLGGATSGGPVGATGGASNVTVPTLSGEGLPAFASSSGDPAIGRPIPEAAGTSFDGTPVRIAADGRPKILLFLAHWCPHCQAEVPVVQRWLDAGRLAADVDLISIATSIDPSRPNYPPDAWLAREGWSAPVLVDPDEAVAARYGLGAFPYWVTVATDGSVAQRMTGELTEAQLDKLVRSITR